jgi:transcriptional repressor NrdR
MAIESKLMRGLIVATVKRNVTTQELEALIDGVEAELHNSFRYEITAKQLGDLVLARLKELDRVAYIRFASVYKDFQDLDEFTAELKGLK